MKVTMLHVSITVADLEKSVAFYTKALDMKLKSKVDIPYATLGMMVDNADSGFELELTCPKEKTEVVGDKKYHFAVTVDDFEAAQKLHEEMGCIQRKVPNKELHFITDPDGNLIEVLSEVQAAK